METDREVLIWLHERLVKVHGEKELYDYMHRLRAIIANTPAKKKTPTECLNGMDDLYRKLKIKPNVADKRPAA